ncbi:MAG TPA: periplasmic heavy metal sensor, partial [Phycisphaerae bacterium]|nr:periplasmic heavy metal sensor [Phycisphaerae bacterium]
MKAKLPWLCVVLMTVWGDVALAEQPGGDPIHSLLIPPEVLMQHRAELRLTDEQVEQMRTRLEKARPEMREVQQRANKAMGRLAELLSADRVDEGAALKQLDKVLTIEKDQKLLHLRIMIQIRNELTAEQRQAAAKIGPTATSNKGLEQRLKAKLSRIEKEMQSRAEAGRPTLDAVGLMQKFQELMQNGQVREAEALLDRVTTALGLDKAGDGASKPRPGRRSPTADLKR